MAEIGYVKSIVGGLQKDIKLALEQAFTYILGNLMLGGLNEGRRAVNFQWYWFSGTTSTTANTEFSIQHGMGKVPTVIIPVLPLSQVGASLVPMQVSRAADNNRIYLTSSSTNAAFTVLVE